MNTDFLKLLESLTWYQIIGEFLALALIFASFWTYLKDKNKERLWRNFLRSTGFLIGSASLVIPWLIKGAL